MTTTPTAFPELPDLEKLEALANQVNNGYGSAHSDFAAAANPAAVLALIALARRAQPEGEAPHWGPVRTVGDLMRNLMTLEQDASIVTAFHVDFEGKRRCRAQQGITISSERVIDGRWIDSSRKDVPHAYVLWAKPGEFTPAATLSPLCGAQHAESGKEAAAAMRVIGGQRWSKEAEMTEGWLAAQQAAAPGSLDARPHKIAELLRIYDEKNGDWCAIARAVESRYVDATSAPGTPEAPIDTERMDWLDQNIFHRGMDDLDAMRRQETWMWVTFAPKGVQGTARSIIDAARAAQLDGGQGEGQ